MTQVLQCLVMCALIVVHILVSSDVDLVPDEALQERIQIPLREGKRWRKENAGEVNAVCFYEQLEIWRAVIELSGRFFRPFLEIPDPIPLTALHTRGKP